jgi:hypothetical protein
MLLGGVGLAVVGGVCAVAGIATAVIALGQVSRIEAGEGTVDDHKSNRLVGPLSYALLGVSVVALAGGGALLYFGLE